MERRVNIAWCFSSTLFWWHLHGRIATYRCPKGNKRAYVGVRTKEYAASCGAAHRMSVFLIEDNGSFGEYPLLPGEQWHGSRLQEKSVCERERWRCGVSGRTKWTKKEWRQWSLTWAMGVTLQRQHPLSNLRLPWEIYMSVWLCICIGVFTKARWHKKEVTPTALTNPSAEGCTQLSSKL